MRVGRWSAAALGLCLATAGAAQTAPRGDVVVTAHPQRQEEKSDWRRAEADHVVVFSRGPERELKRVTNDLERLYFLLSRLYRHGVTTDGTIKLQVVLVDTPEALRALRLVNRRSQEGPFARAFTDARYYEPGEDGALLVVARTDQTVALDTQRRFNKDCDDYLIEHPLGMCGIKISTIDAPSPLFRSWRAVLFGAFAQHFVLTYTPAAYPRWYLDGLGLLFSTVNVHGDGGVDYAEAPSGYDQVSRSYGALRAGDVLTGRYLDPGYKGMEWTPFQAWMLTDYLVLSGAHAERGAQFAQYMTAIGQGAAPAEAARAFGDLGKLQREIASYSEHTPPYAHANAPPEFDKDPLVTTLSAGKAALIEPRVEMESRLADLPDGGVAGPGSPAAGWVAALHDRVAALPYDAEASLLEAEAACRAGLAAECRAAADRVLARSPDDSRALAWLGVAMTGQALAGPTAERAAGLATARETLRRAMALDGDLSPALIGYFRSFTLAGEAAPPDALAAIARAVRVAPAAPGPRLALGRELVRQGRPDLAKRVLAPVLYGGYDTPERSRAAALFAAKAAAAGG